MHGVWSDVQIAGKNVEIYEPANIARPRFGALFLHPLGLETLRGRPAFTNLLDQWKLGQIVAVNIIRKERLTNATAIRRFEREIRAAARLNHPHIVRSRR